MTYDGNNRLKTRDASGGADDLEVTYGGAGELHRLDTPTAASPTVSTVLGYDVAMRQSLRRDIVPGQAQGTTHTFETKYDYNNVDYLTKITYPSLREIVYELDVEGRTLVVKNNCVVLRTTSPTRIRASSRATPPVRSAGGRLISAGADPA